MNLKLLEFLYELVTIALALALCFLIWQIGITLNG